MNVAVDMFIFITAFRQHSGIFSVSYNFGVALSDSLVIDMFQTATFLCVLFPTVTFSFYLPLC